MNDNELLDEALLIYDYNIDALVMHIAYFLDRGKAKSLSVKKAKVPIKIKEDIEEGKNLNKYRLPLNKILESLNSEVEKFKAISKFDITGISSIMCLLSELTKDKETIQMINTKKFENEIVDIQYYTQKILENLNKGE